MSEAYAQSGSLTLHSCDLFVLVAFFAEHRPIVELSQVTRVLVRPIRAVDEAGDVGADGGGDAGGFGGDDDCYCRIRHR